MYHKYNLLKYKFLK